jgi:hypothetical protein
MKLPVLLTLCSNRYSRSPEQSMSTTKPPRTITLATPSGCPAQLGTLAVPTANKEKKSEKILFSFCLEIGRFALPHRRAVRCVAAAIALAMSSLVRPQARQRTKAKQQSTFEKKQGCVFVFQLAWRVDLWMARSLA